MPFLKEEQFQAEMEYPGGSKPDIAIAIIVIPVVEIKTVRVEVANIDVIAIRIKIICLFSSISQEMNLDIL